MNYWERKNLEKQIFKTLDDLIKAVIGMKDLSLEQKAIQDEQAKGLVVRLAEQVIPLVEGRIDQVPYAVQQLVNQRIPGQMLVGSFGDFKTDLDTVVDSGLAVFRQRFPDVFELDEIPDTKAYPISEDDDDLGDGDSGMEIEEFIEQKQKNAQARNTERLEPEFTEDTEETHFAVQQDKQDVSEKEVTYDHDQGEYEPARDVRPDTTLVPETYHEEEPGDGREVEEIPETMETKQETEETTEGGLTKQIEDDVTDIPASEDADDSYPNGQPADQSMIVISNSPKGLETVAPQFVYKSKSSVTTTGETKESKKLSPFAQRKKSRTARKSEEQAANNQTVGGITTQIKESSPQPAAAIDGSLLNELANSLRLLYHEEEIVKDYRIKNKTLQFYLPGLKLAVELEQPTDPETAKREKIACRPYGINLVKVTAEEARNYRTLARALRRKGKGK